MRRCLSGGISAYSEPASLALRSKTVADRGKVITNLLSLDDLTLKVTGTSSEAASSAMMWDNEIVWSLGSVVKLNSYALYWYFLRDLCGVFESLFIRYGVFTHVVSAKRRDSYPGAVQLIDWNG